MSDNLEPRFTVFASVTDDPTVGIEGTLDVATDRSLDEMDAVLRVRGLIGDPLSQMRRQRHETYYLELSHEEAALAAALLAAVELEGPDDWSEAHERLSERVQRLLGYTHSRMRDHECLSVAWVDQRRTEDTNT